jgi:glutamine synthetase
MDTLTDINQDNIKLQEKLQAEGVEYAMASWIDVMGRPKAKIVPISHFPQLLAGAERYTPRGLCGLGEMNPVEEEVIGVPDLSTLVRLPWDRRFAWMIADMSHGGREPFALDPRAALRRQVAAAADMGYDVHMGIEPEFYVFRPESLEPGSKGLIPVARSGATKPSPAYDVEATLDAMEFLDALVKNVNELGFQVYAFGHEGGDGQYELSIRHASVLEMADRMTLIRLAVKQIAKQHGLVATFMPKPYAHLWGSGAHFNMSLNGLADQENKFRDSKGLNGWSDTTYHFIGGILKHSRALTALANPTTNSYRRLTPKLVNGETSWAPTRISYGEHNRSCTIRLPENRPCIEYRAADSSANYYLTAAFMMAAGLEGVREKIHPGEPLETVSTESPAESLPMTLLEAIQAFDQDPLSREVFNEEFVEEYVKVKFKEWNQDHLQVSDFERDKYLLDG